MAQPVLQQILNQIATLSPAELLQVNEVVKERLIPHDVGRARRALYSSLLNAGLLQQIKQRSSSATVRRHLAQVEGQPVSQTIIEERR
jgi:hypothetical protein